MNEKQLLIINKLDAHWQIIKALQESYKSNFGNYFQGLASHDLMPDGETFYDVDMTKKPKDQKHTYYDFWRGVKKGEPNEDGETEEEHQYPEEALGAVSKLTTRTFFNVWDGPDGKGWEIKLEYKDDDGQFEYHRDISGKEQEWSEVIEEVFEV